jgi:hypothetical protein
MVLNSGYMQCILLSNVIPLHSNTVTPQKPLLLIRFITVVMTIAVAVTIPVAITVTIAIAVAIFPGIMCYIIHHYTYADYTMIN